MSNSCQNDDAIETSPQNDLVYKEKLEKLITLGKPIDLKTSKIDVSNALKFKNYEEAYNYIKKNKEFTSDTITGVLKSISPSITSKSSTITNGYDTRTYYEVFHDFSVINNHSLYASINTTYSFNCSISYAYQQENYTKKYYTSYVNRCSATNLTSAFQGVGYVTQTSSLNASNVGSSLGWTQIFQQKIAIVDPDNGVIYNWIIEVRGYVNVGSNWNSLGISNPTYSHYIVATYK